MKKLHNILCALALCLPLIAEAAAPQAISLSYMIGQNKPDMTRDVNRDSYSRIVSELTQRRASGEELAVSITYYSAPDGLNAINRNVGISRADRLRASLAEDAKIAPALIEVTDGKDGWALMRRIVASTPGVDNGDEIIAAIDGDSDMRMKRLRQMHGGATYKYLRSYIFPLMRSLVTVVIGTPEEVAAARKADEDVAFLGHDPAPESPAADIVMLPANAVRLIYLIGQTKPDMSRRSNKSGYDAIIKEIERRKAAGEPTAVYVAHFSAPDGVNDVNRNVGITRSETLRKSISGDTSADVDLIAINNDGVEWGEVRHIVASNPGIRDSRRILEIIDGDPAERMSRLRRLNKGATYSYLREHVFPTMRSTIAVVVGDPEALKRQFGLEDKSAPAPRPAISAPSAPSASVEAKHDVPAKSGEANPRFERWAFKTNLLYDVVLAPSLEVEYSFTPSWSVNLEYEMAWWKSKSKNKVYQVAAVSPEVRWWFRSPSPFRGHYLGAFPGFTWYDLENGGTGHRGHAWFAGVSYGFMFPVSDKLSFDAELGVGYMRLNYKDYEPLDGHHVYQRAKTAGYFGPLKVKFALVWRPWAVKSK